MHYHSNSMPSTTKCMEKADPRHHWTYTHPGVTKNILIKQPLKKIRALIFTNTSNTWTVSWQSVRNTGTVFQGTLVPNTSYSICVQSCIYIKKTHSRIPHLGYCVWTNSENMVYVSTILYSICWIFWI